MQNPFKKLFAALKKDEPTAEPIEKPKADDLETGQVARLVHQPKVYGDHPSKGLTPVKLHQILEDAEQGDITAQHELFADIEEKDGHIAAEMSKRKNALLKLDWNIKPPKNATPAEKKQTEEIAEWFDRLNGFDGLVLDLADAIGHGFSAIELTWEFKDGLWMPKKFEHRSQSWFKLSPQDEIRLKSANQEGEALWPLGWIVHKHRAKSGQLSRMGLFRTLAWPYLFKNYSVSDLAELLEIYGIPVRIGKYPPNSPEEERKALINALISIGHNAAGIMPEGMNIEFAEAASGSVAPFETMIKWCEKTASKVILGGTLTTEADGKSSTNALGKIHNDVRHDILSSDARQLEDTFNQFIEKWAMLNKGQLAGVRPPKLYFDIKDPEEVAQTAELIVRMVSVGMKVPAAWAHSKVDIPLAVDGEDVLTTQPSGPPLPVAANSHAYRQVALSSDGSLTTPDQAALDEAKNGLDAANLNAQIAPLIAQISAKISKGASYEEAIEALNNLYPHLDADLFQDVMARALFVSDVWGRINEQS